MKESEIIIREPVSVEEFYQVETIQAEALRFSPAEVVPASYLLANHENGGQVFVAVQEPDAQMIGFLFGLVSLGERQDFRYYTYLLGVLPTYQGRGIGQRLMLAQRDAALEQGAEVITWNFDPMDAVTANLTLRKLGALVSQVESDVKSPGFAALRPLQVHNSLQARWQIHSPRTNHPIQDGSAPSTRPGRMINQTLEKDGLLRLENFDLNLSEISLLLEIPADFLALLQANLEVAQEWRRVVVEILSSYLSRQYELTGFISEIRGDQRRNLYLLSRTAFENR